MTLHLSYTSTMTVRERLDRWEGATRRDVALGPGNWRMLAMWPAARDAAISGSTGIEGNPLSPTQVEEILAGAAVDADADHIREVENYNRALNLASDAAARPGFAWSHEVIQLINATVMEGLPRDTRGDYRGPGEDVFVGIFTGPSPIVVRGLMDELIGSGSPSEHRRLFARRCSISTSSPSIRSTTATAGRRGSSPRWSSSETAFNRPS